MSDSLTKLPILGALLQEWQFERPIEKLMHLVVYDDYCFICCTSHSWQF
jgi:hypothetical protein